MKIEKPESLTLTGWFALFIIVVITLAMQGCTAAMNQATVAFESAAIQNIKASNDIGISNWRTIACATPYSAILRHPDLWDVMPKLCAPGAMEATPQSILAPVKP